MNHFGYLILISLSVACSTPNYVYQFQNNNQLYYSSHSSHTSSIIQTKSVTISDQWHNTINDSSLIYNPNAKSELLASTSNASIINNPVDQRIRNTIGKESNKTISLKKSSGLFALPVISQEGDPKKNYAAAVGLVLSLVSFAIWPLVIPALIFSLIGLKSEKKKIATIGLILSIILITVGLIAIIYFVAVGGYGM